MTEVAGWFMLINHPATTLNMYLGEIIVFVGQVKAVESLKL